MRQTPAPALLPVSEGETDPRSRVSSTPHELSGPLPARPHWGLARLAGSLVEISGTADSGVLSSALALVAEAQHNQVRRHRNRHRQDRPPHRPRRDRGEPSDSDHALAAWVATTRSLFFPPDAVESGISLDRLILLRLKTPGAQVRAATRIVHSGAFELVVVDLADSIQSGSDWNAVPLSRPNTSPGVPPLSRLAGLAHKYRTAVVLLTDKPPAAPSLDPRVGKRFDASRRENDIVITVLKDKGRGGASPSGGTRGFPPFHGGNHLVPGFRFERECREPAGMC